MADLHEKCEICGGLAAHLPWTLDMRSAVECKLAEFASCQCCGTHQRNKPTKWRPWVELPFHGNQEEKACKCSCRQEARVICMMHPDCKTFRSQVPSIRCYGERLCREHQLTRIEGTWAATCAWPLQSNFAPSFADEMKRRRAKEDLEDDFSESEDEGTCRCGCGRQTEPLTDWIDGHR